MFVLFGGEFGEGEDGHQIESDEEKRVLVGERCEVEGMMGKGDEIGWDDGVEPELEASLVGEGTF